MVLAGRGLSYSAYCGLPFTRGQSLNSVQESGEIIPSVGSEFAGEQNPNKREKSQFIFNYAGLQ